MPHSSALRTNTPKENTVLRIAPIPTRFEGTGRKVGYPEKGKTVAVLKDLPAL